VTLLSLIAHAILDALKKANRIKIIVQQRYIYPTLLFFKENNNVTRNY